MLFQYWIAEKHYHHLKTLFVDIQSYRLVQGSDCKLFCNLSDCWHQINSSWGQCSLLGTHMFLYSWVIVEKSLVVGVKSFNFEYVCSVSGTGGSSPLLFCSCQAWETMESRAAVALEVEVVAAVVAEVAVVVDGVPKKPEFMCYKARRLAEAL